MKKHKSAKQYWYFIEYFECPVCCKNYTAKKRMYTRKPKSIDKRFKFHNNYCGCIY